MIEKQNVSVFEKLERIEISILNKIDSNLKNDSIDVLNDFNYSKLDPYIIYSSIEKMERTLIIDRSFNELCVLICEAYNLNSKKTISIINNKQTIVEIYFCIRCLKSQQILDIIQGNHSLHSHFLFMCIRQLTCENAKSNIEIKKNDLEKVLANAAIRISNIDKKLWIYLIFYFERHLNYYNILAMALMEIDERSIIVFSRNINIEIHQRSLGQIMQAFEILSDDRLNYILKTIFLIIKERWSDYLRKLKQKKTFLNGLIQTGYTNLIYWSIFYSIPDVESFEKEWFSQLAIINNDVFEWYNDITEFRTNFFVDITQLALLAQVYIEKNYKFSHILEIQDKLEKLEIVLKKNEDLWENNDEKEFIHKNIRAIKLTLQQT